jgi:hypothetical protein
MTTDIAQQGASSSTTIGPLVSLDPAAWIGLARRGLVILSAADGDTRPAVIITISEAGKAAQQLADHAK